MEWIEHHVHEGKKKTLRSFIFVIFKPFPFQNLSPFKIETRSSKIRFYPVKFTVVRGDGGHWLHTDDMMQKQQHFLLPHPFSNVWKRIAFISFRITSSWDEVEGEVVIDGIIPFRRGEDVERTSVVGHIRIHCGNRDNSLLRFSVFRLLIFKSTRT